MRTIHELETIKEIFEVAQHDSAKWAMGAPGVLTFNLDAGNTINVECQDHHMQLNPEMLDKANHLIATALMQLAEREGLWVEVDAPGAVYKYRGVCATLETPEGVEYGIDWNVTAPF